MGKDFEFGDYSVKKVKQFRGMDDYGYNATLCRKGKEVAFCIDEGSGGEVSIDFFDRRTGKQDEHGFPIMQKSVEQGIFEAFIASLPQVESPYDDPAEGASGKMILTVDETWFIWELVNEFERDKEWKKIEKLMATKTIYTTDGKSMWEVKEPYSEYLAAKLRTQHPKDNLTFLNTLPIAEARRAIGL